MRNSVAENRTIFPKTLYICSEIPFISRHDMRKVLYPFCCALFLYACQQTPPKPPVVGVENVAVDNIEIYGEYAGLIKAYRSVEIHARVEGFLERMTFDEGKQVAAGEPLFYINDALYKAKVEKARAQLKKDEAQAAKADRDLKRIRPLYELNAASRLDLDNAEAAYDMALASVAMSKADLAQAELELSYTVVRSPLSGYISERYVDVGTLVGKSNSSLLANVVKRDTVLIDFKLTALDYLRSQRRNVHLGELDTSRSWQPTVTVTLADNSVYGQKGVVDFASPQVDPKTGTFGVRAELPNPHQVFLPGQFTRVKLLLDVLENVMVVPQKAVSIEKGGAFIFVVRADSVAEKRFVETGPEQDNRIVVVRGLSPDEKIVVEGYQKLTHGQKVTWRDPGDALIRETEAVNETADETADEAATEAATEAAGAETNQEGEQ